MFELQAGLKRLVILTGSLVVFGDRTRAGHSPLLKLDLGLPPGFALEGRVPEDVLVDNGFVQRNIHRVSEAQNK